ncbi:hypothetical protein OC842_006958 [Tilletia horrida]|uniref:UBP-type domain-containing protein n=1 Tax=Tilletia horrida TaxID=155126 RepID=A0AAN6G4U8_9BASI|nr:hypothetical protein OC842_006958 [Tilletia horrida]
MSTAPDEETTAAAAAETAAAETASPSTVAASFHVHLTLLKAPTSTLRIIPTNIFDRLPTAEVHAQREASDKGEEDDALARQAAAEDDALALRIRKEPVDVDQRLGPIALDWADNDSLLSVMYGNHAQARPPHVRTPSHLRAAPQQRRYQSQEQEEKHAQPSGPAFPTNTSAPTSSAPSTPAAAASAQAPASSSSLPQSSSAISAEVPIPVARYTQQSTFSTADDELTSDEPTHPQRSPAATVQASNSSYSVARTHVAFGIVHLFRDQTEADDALALEQSADFPTLSSAASSSGAVATSSKTLLSSTPSSAAHQQTASAASASGSGTPADAVQVTTDEEAGSILGILAVPGYMTAADFLAFIEPAADAISHIRMIRELQTEKCMVLIKFRDPFDAEEFHKMFNGQPFNAINEDELCQVVYITSVTISASYTLPHAYPLLANSDPWPMLPPTSARVAGSQSQSQSNGSPSLGGPSSNAATSSLTAAGATEQQRLATQLTYELPTCPVCLERMDSNVTGLMTTRQRNGLAGPSLSAAQSRCTICKTASDLWVCLICASVGCGRYKAGHAHQHFQETGHLYSLELETQRVWDYAGDGYVHRLIQNKADGKLVELPSASSAASTPARAGGAGRSSRGGPQAGWDDTSFSAGTGKGQGSSAQAGGLSMGGEPEDKVESLGLEYSYLIVSQLESQRAFYEEQVKLLQTELESSQTAHASSLERLAQAETQLAALQARLEQVEQSNVRLGQERERAEKRAERQTELMRKHERDLHTERAQTQGLLSNLGLAQRERVQLEDEMKTIKAELEDVREQMRDLMFFVSARERIAGDEELAGADVVGVPGKKDAEGGKKGGGGGGGGAGAGAGPAGTAGAGGSAGNGSSTKKKKKKSANKPPPAVMAQLASAAAQKEGQGGPGVGSGAQGGAAGGAGAGPSEAAQS